MIAWEFKVIHSATVRRSSDVRRPATTLGEGRRATTAVLSMFICLPWVMFTLIRTSWRALPRGLAHTDIGKPVMRGDRFVISKMSSVFVSSASDCGRFPEVNSGEIGRLLIIPAPGG